MALQVSSKVIAQLLHESASAHPDECCGILLGDGDRIDAILPTRNVHLSPHTHFEIDPQALIDAHRAARRGGSQVMGYYHSHPHGGAGPSSNDQACSARDGSVWAIVAMGTVRFWKDSRDGFQTLSYTLADG